MQSLKLCYVDVVKRNVFHGESVMHISREEKENETEKDFSDGNDSGYGCQPGSLRKSGIYKYIKKQ